MDQQCFPTTGHILRLSDEILLMILKHLSCKDLFSIYRSCNRFRNVCCEESLWRKINGPPDDYSSLRKIFNRFLHPRTSYLRIESKSHSENLAFRPSFSPSQISVLLPTHIDNLTSNLTHLYIIRQRINKQLFNLRLLPPSLKVLHLTGTHIDEVTEQSCYFKDVGKRLCNLEDFDLSDCTWVPSHSLLALSKFPSLQRISFRGCRQIGNCIAYSSLAFRFGFKSLKILDVTNTQFGTGEFHSIVMLTTLEAFYVGDYDRNGDGSVDGISDFTLHTLRGLEHLKTLDLSGHDITDKGLDILAPIKSLKRIDLHLCPGVTLEGISQFSEARPDCVINKQLNFL